MDNKKFIEIAIDESKINSKNGYKDGGPFGAVIVKDGRIIARAHNTVLKSKDATAHAEINAIREASKVLATHDLTGCTLYVNAQPCPMCLSAIIWSNIKEVYYVLTKEDANNIGFRDDIIYEYIKGKNNNVINLHKINNNLAKQVFDNFNDVGGQNIY